MENATDTIHRPGFYTIDIVETQGHYTANIAESQGFTQQTIEEDQYMQRKYSKDLNVSFLHQNQPDLDFGTIITVGASRFIPRQALLYTSHNRSLQQQSQQTHGNRNPNVFLISSKKQDQIQFHAKQGQQPPWPRSMWSLFIFIKGLKSFCYPNINLRGGVI